MFEINAEKLSKEINDTLLHRNFVLRSGQYLAAHLMQHHRNLDAIQLIVDAWFMTCQRLIIQKSLWL